MSLMNGVDGALLTAELEERSPFADVVRIAGPSVTGNIAHVAVCLHGSFLTLACVRAGITVAKHKE